MILKKLAPLIAITTTRTLNLSQQSKEEETGVSKLIPRRRIKALYGYEIQLIALKLQTRKLLTSSNNQMSYNLIVTTAMHSSLRIPFSRPPPPLPLPSRPRTSIWNADNALSIWYKNAIVLTRAK